MISERRRILALIESLDELVKRAGEAYGALADSEIQDRMLEIEEQAIGLIYWIADIHRVDMSRELGWGFTHITAETATNETQRVLPRRGNLKVIAAR
ncbi:MAG: hypothetical protein PVJ32_04365 [Anaerolineales bacterium]|jgi:hypothetical protein